MDLKIISVSSNHTSFKVRSAFLLQNKYIVAASTVTIAGSGFILETKWKPKIFLLISLLLSFYTSCMSRTVKKVFRAG